MTELMEVQPSGALNTRMEQDTPHIHHYRFPRAYEDIWGSQRAKKRFQDELSLPLEHARDVVPSERKRTTNEVVQKHGKGLRLRRLAFRRLRHYWTKVLRPSDSARRRGLLYRKSLSNARREIPLVRAKYIRLLYMGKDHKDSFSSFWVDEFTRISRKYDSQLYSSTVPRPRLISKSENFKGTDRIYRLLVSASVEKIREKWKALSQKERDDLWPKVMIRTLKNDQRAALKFIVATSCRPHPPSYAVSDSLEYIVSYFLYNVGDPDIATVAILFRTVTGLLDLLGTRYLHLTQKTIFLLLLHLPIDEVEELYATLAQRNHPIQENTLLQFISAFARKGRTQLALDALQKFHDNGGDINKPRVKSVCATLLQRKYRGASNHSMSDSDIFRELLGLGLQPNIIIYNILVQNAVEAGHPETAWQIHAMMLENGINADVYTYSILFKDAKLRGDRSAMERVMDFVKSKEIANEHIITDILHGMFLINETERHEKHMERSQIIPASPIKRMLPLYAEYFDLEPIRGLLTQPYRNLDPQSNREKMHPSGTTLVVMFTALIRGFSNYTSLTQWYDRFRTMVLNGHPDIAPLAESTYIYDALIMCLGRWPETLPLCTNVIRDMLSSYSEDQETKVELDLQSRRQEKSQSTKDCRSTSASAQNSAMEDVQVENASSTRKDELDRSPKEIPPADVHGDTTLACENLFQHSTLGDVSTAPSSVVSWPASVNAGVPEQSSHNTSIRHCKPSVRTWSILLKAFMDQKQPRAAEKVLKLMRRQGIAPNLVTWNKLVTGYARMQDIPNTVNAISRLEDEGWEADPFTMSGLGRIVNREALWQALREKDLQRGRKQYEEEAKKAENKARRLSGCLEYCMDKVVDKADQIHIQDQTHGQEEKERRQASIRAWQRRTAAPRRPPRALRLHEDELPFPKGPLSRQKPDMRAHLEELEMVLLHLEET